MERQVLSKYYPWLLLAAGVLLGVLAGVLVWADQHNPPPYLRVIWVNQNNNPLYWHVAQASLLVILLLLALLAWGWLRINRDSPPLSGEAGVYYRAISKLTRCVAIGYIAILLNANRLDRWQYGVVAKAIGYGTLAAGGFFVAGVLFGFLFGFRPTSPAPSSIDQSPKVLHHPYTNLEEIADWLTKLILGASLVSLATLRGLIWHFAQVMARGVDPPAPYQDADPGSPAFALAIMIFFSVSGILYGYLWTRYEHEVAEDMPSVDTLAVALVTRWLNAPNTPDDQSRAGMMNAIKVASPAAKVKMFREAEQYRKPSTRDVNDRALPVFQALVEADLLEVFHRNRGQYAFALMGKKKGPQNSDADWNQAFALLSSAIRIRDESGETGWEQYEFARAVCQIHLDHNFKTKQPSDADKKQSIRADVDKAAGISGALSRAIDSEDVVQQWKDIKDNVA